MSTRRVVLVDPVGFTPGYDAGLGAALARQGWCVEWATSSPAFGNEIRPPRVERLEMFRSGAKFARWFRLFGRQGRIAGRALAYPVDLWRLDRYLNAGVPGILHVQWVHAPMTERRLWRRWRRGGWRIVYTAHDPQPLMGTNTSVPCDMLHEADAVIVHDDASRSALLEAGFGSDQLHKIPAGPPVAPCQFPPDKREAKRKLSLPDQAPVVLFFGYNKPYKGLDLLIEAFDITRQLEPSAKLVIAGARGPRVASRRDIKGVLWLERYVTETEMLDFFGATDVVALPYRQASSSGVLLTAWAHYRPVVATAVGSFVELLRDGGGMLALPDDPNDFGTRIAAAFQDPCATTIAGAEGRKRLDTVHCWETIAEQTSAVYEQCRAI